MSTTQTNMAELRTQAQPREAQLPTVRAGFTDLAGFELAQRAAKALSASSLVPQNYRGNLADCIVALELAQRIGASPLMVMQNLYIVHGKPAWSSQFLIAAVNQCGRYSALKYEWSGEKGKDSWACRAYATEKATGERVQGPEVSIKMAKDEGWYTKNGSKWQTIPELMLMYRAATFFARTNAPELTMGLQSQEEAYDIIDAEQTAPGRFEATLETLEPAPPTAQPEPKDKKPKPKAAALSQDEATILIKIDSAKDAETAADILDSVRGEPFYATVTEAYNNRWAQTV